MPKTYSFEWTGQNENHFRLEASCERTLQYQVIYADGDVIQTKNPEILEKTTLVVFMNGKQIDSSTAGTYWWKILDLNLKDLPGYKRIWAIDRVAFPAQVGSQIHSFLDDVIEIGTQLDARLFQIEKKLQSETSRLNGYQDVLNKCEAQMKHRGELPDAASAKKEMQDYNYHMNEGWDGGSGYVPHIYSMEEYQDAKNIISEAKAAIDILQKKKEEITENCVQIYTEKEDNSPAHFSLHPTQQDKTGKLYILPVGFHVFDNSGALQILDENQKKKALTSGIDQMTNAEIPMIDDYKLLAKENLPNIVPEQHAHRRNRGIEL